MLVRNTISFIFIHSTFREGFKKKNKSNFPLRSYLIFTAAARRAKVLIMARCPFVSLSLCHVTFSKPLMGQKRECCLIEEVIEVDEHDENNLKLAAAGKQHKK